MPKGAIQSRTDFGSDGYSGPCPPAGDKPHHYQITVFAVDVDRLPGAKNDAASAALVGFDLHFHTLAQATLTGLYGREAFAVRNAMQPVRRASKSAKADRA